MLEVRGLSISYGQHRALDDVSIRVDPGEIVVILGANGAGKSTLLKTIGGLIEENHSGVIELDHHPILGLPAYQIVNRGIALVPEGRGIFSDLTVKENLMLGAYCERAREDSAGNLDRVLSLFPKLTERQNQIVRTMSGGEQQMVAIGRAMMSAPSILMLDEPSLGLSPLLCKELFHSLTEVRRAGVGILLVEQNAKQSLAIADRGYLLENAHIVLEDKAANLINDPAVQKAYLGVATGAPVLQKAVATTAPGDHTAAARVAAESALAMIAGTSAPSGNLSFVTTGKAPLRLRTDDVIAGGIDVLVSEAAAMNQSLGGNAQLSKTSPGNVRPVRRPSAKIELGPLGKNEIGFEGRLAAVLLEIEQAAASARNSVGQSRQAANTTTGDTPKVETNFQRSKFVQENRIRTRVKGD